MSLIFNNTYIKLPEHFYAAILPETVKAPVLVKWNDELAKSLNSNLEHLSLKERAEYFSGNRHLEGSQALAQAYAGHQFGGLSPQLGDGRAHLLGEVINTKGQRVDIQLKGSGRTPYSRGGDGKATLYSVLREHLISEAMFNLGIPTTRSLAVVASGETIVRNGLAIPSAILTRVADSHIRVGTFQYFALRGEDESVKALADYTIERHYSEALEADNSYLSFFQAVLDKQIALITQWTRVGFIHGVMNTDNVTISGETIDFGPCAFLDTYNPQTKFSSIDRQGRYAFANQANISYWNMARFAEALISVVANDSEKAVELLTEVLQTYPVKLARALHEMQCKKFGFLETRKGDEDLINEFYELLQRDEVDYTLAFRALTERVMSDLPNDSLTATEDNLFNKSGISYKEWRAQWLQRMQTEETNKAKHAARMNKSNPIYIPRNWHVEQALTTAADKNDFTLFDELLLVLQQPYTHQAHLNKYASTPFPSTSAYKTYCGT